MQKEGSPRVVIKEDPIFNFLHHIRLNKTIYPFTLKGDEYLNSKWKRALDLAVGGIFSVPALLPLGIAMAGVYIENPGISPLLRQRRIGRYNIEFDMYKVRTQNIDTSSSGKISPTRIGRVLRSLSIDELPQLFALISGEMSAVGRRPVLPIDWELVDRLLEIDLPYIRSKRRFNFNDEQWETGDLPEGITRESIEEYSDKIRKRTIEILLRYVGQNNGKPGLTGLYQILGRRNLDSYTRTRLDNFYETHASLGLDLAILAATIPAILTRRGAK